MEDCSFEEEIQRIRDSLKKMREATDDEWFLSRLRGISNSPIQRCGPEGQRSV